MKDDILPLVDDHCQRIAVEVGRHLDALDVKFKKGMRYMLQEIDALKSRPPRVGSSLLVESHVPPIRAPHLDGTVADDSFEASKFDRGPTCTEFLQMAALTKKYCLT